MLDISYDNRYIRNIGIIHKLTQYSQENYSFLYKLKLICIYCW